MSKLVNKTIRERAYNFDQQIRAKQRRDLLTMAATGEEQYTKSRKQQQNESAVIEKLEELFRTDEFRALRRDYAFDEQESPDNEKTLVRFVASWFTEPTLIWDTPACVSEDIAKKEEEPTNKDFCFSPSSPQYQCSSPCYSFDES